MGKLLTLVAASGAILTSGCLVTSYAPPPADVETATLLIVPEADWPGQQRFWSSPDEACRMETILGSRTPVWGGPKPNTPILTPTGQDLYLRAFSDTFTGYCANRVAFRPLAGKTYRVRHLLEGSVCRIDLVDAETGVPPQDVRAVEPNFRCG